MSYGYITKLSDKVERQHVRFNNRFLCDPLSTDWRQH